MIRSPAGRLIVWNNGNDQYNYKDLQYNFENIDRLIGNDGFVAGGTGSAGSTANVASGSAGNTATRRQDLTGVASAWLGPGDKSKIYYKGTHVSSPDPDKSRLAPARTLYRIIYALTANQAPLGQVTMWYRHDNLISPPAGWEICDGRILQSDDHSFGDYTYQMPDLRNKFIIGGDLNKLRTDAGLAGDNLNFADGNNGGLLATNAPGVGYDSIRNTSSATRKAKNGKRNLSHTHSSGSFAAVAHSHAHNHAHIVPTHSHVVPAHTHYMDHVHTTPEHYHGSDLVSRNNPGAGGNFTSRDVVAQPDDAKSTSPWSTYNWQAMGVGTTFSVQTSPSRDFNIQFHGLDASFFPRLMFNHYFTSTPVHSTSNVHQDFTAANEAALTSPDGQGGTSGPNILATNPSGAEVTGTSAAAGYSTTSEIDGGGLIDVRPAFVGLLFIMKVKKYFGIIDDDRNLFDSL